MLYGSDPFRDFPRRAAGMPIDAYRRGDEFLVEVDLPGVDPASVELTVDRNVLTIQAERSHQSADGDRVIAAERPHGRFTRRVVLGQTLDASQVAARYEHGVLTVTVPVAEAAKPRRVEITVATPSADAQAA